MKLTRRQAWTGALCAAAALDPPALAVAAAAAVPFADRVGLCVHLDSPPYRDQFAAVERAVSELGVVHLRDELRPGNDIAGWRHLYQAHGVRNHLLVSPSTNTVAEMVQYLAAVGIESVSAIEGQNEGDSPWFTAQPAARPNWATAVTTYQREIYRAIRDRFGAASLPVLSPSLLDYRPEDVHAIAGSAAFCDMVAIHAYAQGQQEPETTDDYAGLAWYLREFRDTYRPGAPVMVTETGYATTAGGLSPRAAAIYLPRLLLHACSVGIARTFLYELMDEGDDTADPEQRYGLIGPRGVPKPAFHALRLLMAGLGTASPAPDSGVSMIEGPDDVRQMGFVKPDGEVIVALWRPARSWDPQSKRDIDVPSRRVRLRSASRRADVAALPLQHGKDWSALSAGGAEWTIDISDIVTLMRVRN